MTGIKQFEYKYVELKDNDDNLFIGDIIEVEAPWEDDKGYWSLALEREDGVMIAFKESDIKSIREIKE